MVEYHWIVEVVDADGGILDTDSVESFAEALQWADNNSAARIALVRDSDTGAYGDRQWCYIDRDGSYVGFEDGSECLTGAKVPVRFVREIAKAQVVEADLLQA